MKEEAKQRILDEIAVSKKHYNAIIEIMNSLKLVSKKTGGSYESLPRNFAVEGDAVKKYNVAIKWEKSIFDTRRFDAMKLHYKAAEEGYNTLYFYTYECLSKREPKHAEMKANGRLVDGGFGLKDFYEFTPAEILENVKTERERASKCLKFLEDNEGELVAKGLEILEHINAIKTLQKELADSGGKWDSTGYLPIRRALESDLRSLC